MHFEKLSVDQLRADRELIQALPDRLKKAVVELNPDRSDEPPRQSRLGADRPAGRAVAVAVGRAAGACSRAASSAAAFRWRTSAARCRCAGEFDGQHLQSRGELALDSLTYKDCQFTRVMGPIWIDDGRVLFGGWVDRPENGAVPGEAVGPLQKPRLADGQPVRRHALTATAG